MSGSLRWVNKEDPIQKHDHFDLVIEDTHAVRLNDPRRFGAVLWQHGNAPHKVLQGLGPEPLPKKFQGNTLHQRLQSKKTPIKVALMNPRVVVGVGNIYATEALFRARIDPRKPAQNLTTEECNTLVHEVKYVLKKGIEMGGSTLRNFHGIEGQVGTFAANSLAYGKTGQPCPICQTPFTTINLGGRATTFCAHCQK
jgi:formamidopyrimidine-DNA glycosylase